MCKLDVSSELESIVNVLWLCRSIDSVAVSDEIRVSNAGIVEQWYYKMTGLVIPNEHKESLTEYLLYRGTDDGKRSSYFTDKYPYLSEYQQRQRHSKETSIEFAEHYDTNGVSRAPKTRTNRLGIEEALNVKKWRTNEYQTDNNKGV